MSFFDQYSIDQKMTLGIVKLFGTLKYYPHSLREPTRREDIDRKKALNYDLLIVNTYTSTVQDA